MNIDKDNRRVRFSLGDCASCASIRRSQYTVNNDYGDALPRKSRSRRSHSTHDADRRSRPVVVAQEYIRTGLPGGRGGSSTMSFDPYTKPYSPSLTSSDTELDMNYSEKSSQCTQPTDPYRLMPMVYSPPPTPGVHKQHFVYVVGDKSMSPAPVVIIESTHENSYKDHKRLAVVVFFLCGFLFGLVAYLLAAAAGRKRKNNEESQQLAKASIGVSVCGIVVGILLAIGISVGVTLSRSVCLPNGHNC